MAMVDKGQSRQETHEQIRVLSHEAGAVVKKEGKPNDLIDRIKNNSFFQPVLADLEALTNAANFIGRCLESFTYHLHDHDPNMAIHSC